MNQTKEFDRVLDARSLENQGFRFEMTHEEMLEAYDVSLYIQTIVIFYSVALGTVIFSVIIPVFYITRLNPKGILLKGSIG